VLELLNRVGADGWGLADRQEHRERGNGPATGIPTGQWRLTPSRIWSRA